MTQLYESGLDNIQKKVESFIKQGIDVANRIHLPPLDFIVLVKKEITSKLNHLGTSIPTVLFHSGIAKTYGNASLLFRVDVKPGVHLISPATSNLTLAFNSKDGKKFTVLYSYVIKNFDLRIFKSNADNLDNRDWHKISQAGRKVSSGLLAVSLPFEQAFSRANLYSAPMSESKTLIIFQKKILGSKFHVNLGEMNAIKAGRLGKGLWWASKVVGGASAACALYDINKNGFSTSNSLDLVMSGMALSGVGTSIAGTYFIVNGVSIIFTDKDIGQHIDQFLK